MDKISKCCSALLNDFNVCLSCLESSEAVDVIEEENELREMQEEEASRKESLKKY